MKRAVLILLFIALRGTSQEGELKWKFQTGDRIESSPVIAPDGIVYVRSRDNYLYAINPDGSEKWRFSAPWGSYKEISPAVAPDTSVFVTSYEYLYCLDTAGNVKWDYRSGFYPRTPAFGTDGTVYVSDSNILYALTSQGERKWQFEYPTSEFTAPVIDVGGIIYVGCIGLLDSWHGILALQPEGTLEWAYETDTAIHTPLSIGFGGIIYFGTYSCDLLALKPDGSLMWRYETPSKIYFPPSVGPDSTLYFGDYDFNFYALRHDGTLKWEYPLRVTYSIPAVGSDGTVYVDEPGKYLYAFSPSGEVLWRYYYGGGANSSPAVAPDGTIYLSGWYDCSLHAITSSSEGLSEDSPWARYRHDNQHSGRVHHIPAGTKEETAREPALELIVGTLDNQLRVAYIVPEGQQGSLNVYDASGRRIQTMQVKGEGQICLPSSLACGVYFIRLEAQGKVKSARTVLVR